VKLCTPQCAWLLKRLAFAEVGELTSFWHKNMNCYRATVVCLDAKGLWKPGQSFILAGFTLSMPRSAPCGTEQTTTDTGCDPALLRNCVTITIAITFVLKHLQNKNQPHLHDLM